MSNPTGDALHAAGLEDDGGLIHPIEAPKGDTSSKRNNVRDLAKLRAVILGNKSRVDQRMEARTV